MLPNPLHPAVVHFPIALAFLLPLGALWALVAIRRGASTRRAWVPVGVLAALLFLSAWVSVNTGQSQEDRAEDVVGEQVLGGHEEAAERFLIASGALLGLVAAGLLRGRLGAVGRGVATAGSLAALAMVVQVGHSGGELVYTHGAAQAYVGAAAPGAGENARVPARSGDDDDDEGRERGRAGGQP